MDKKINWNLDNILKLEDFDKYYQKTEKLLPEFDEYFAKLEPEMSPLDFIATIDFEEMVGDRMSRLRNLPMLIEATNQKDTQAKLMKSKVDDLQLRMAAKSRKISQWIKGLKVENKNLLDDDNARRLFSGIAELEYSLNYARKAARYSLNLNQEEIIDHKDVTGVQALVDLRTMIETEFEYSFQSKILKTQAELMSYVYSPKALDREEAYKTLLNKHKDNIDKFFLIYQAIVKDWDYEAKLRGYESPISIRNFANHIPDKAIETLLEVCRQNRYVFQDFFKFKAKELGLKKLKREDIYAPLFTKKENKVSYEDAWKLINSTFEEFSEDFSLKAKKMADEKHIDVYPSENKISGAFCDTVGPKVTPYVLLNFTGKERDIPTLAHELGHGIHSLYANKLRHSVQHANLPLAETASTFGEMVLFEKMYQKETDPEKKKSMLAEKVADSYATILRQSYFIIFERKAHEAISKGTTAKQIGEIWMETLREQFGNSVEVNDLFAYEWAYIPHIVNTPFYCYAYNFGELLSLSLFAKYKEEGSSFVPKLEKILSSGGSMDPNKVLKEVGIDMSSKSFWEGSFKIIESWVKELNKIG